MATLKKDRKLVFKTNYHLTQVKWRSKVLQNAFWRMHSAILSTFIKLPIVIKTIVLSIFEWPYYTSFSVPSNFIPTPKHFWNLQYGHLFLWLLSIGQLRLSTHEYTFLFCTVRLKNPENYKHTIMQNAQINKYLSMYGISCSVLWTW